jgi:hypothetical protein
VPQDTRPAPQEECPSARRRLETARPPAMGAEPRAAPTGTPQGLSDQLPAQLVIGRAGQSADELGQSQGAIARHRTPSELQGLLSSIRRWIMSSVVVPRRSPL